MNSSENIYKFTQMAALMAGALIVGWFFSFSNTTFQEAYWIAEDAEILSKGGEWEPIKTRDIDRQLEPIKLKYKIEISDRDFWKKPIGLMVSGPFSAELHWDGNFVGEKGKVFKEGQEEMPGKIDTIFHLPFNLLEQGTHNLEVTLSTQKINYEAESIIHLIALGPYREDERRSLRYYFIPLSLIGGLIFLLVQNFRIGFKAGSRVHYILALFAFFVLVNLLAEVSRALINYPYDYHLFRSIPMWLSAVGAGLSLFYLTFYLEKATWARILLALAFMNFLWGPGNGEGGDGQIVRDFIFLSFGPALIYLIKIFKKQFSFMSLIPIYWIACIVGVVVSSSVYLDIYFFVASSILLTASWLSVYWGFSPPKEESSVTPLISFIIKSKGREISLNANKVVLLRAEGNYTEILDEKGENHLHQSRLGALMENSPQGFVRVHRSFAVNKGYIKSLRTSEGSKYWLEMDVGEDVPVSRYRVAEIRKVM